jgi:hypothetical protein
MQSPIRIYEPPLPMLLLLRLINAAIDQLFFFSLLSNPRFRSGNLSYHHDPWRLSTVRPSVRPSVALGWKPNLSIWIAAFFFAPRLNVSAMGGSRFQSYSSQCPTPAFVI